MEPSSAVDRLATPGGLAFLCAALLVALSTTLPSPLGRFKPVPLLLTLFACYNIVPFVATIAFPDFARLLLGETSSYYDAANLDRIGLLVFGCVLSGVIGHAAASVGLHGRRRPPATASAALPNGRPPPRVYPTASALSFCLLLLLACALLWQLRGFLFSGYHEAFGEDTGEVVLRGSLSSVFSLLFIAYLFMWFSNDDARRRPLRVKKLFRASTTALVLVGVCLLSTGGRLYIVSAVVTVLGMRAARPLRKVGARTGSFWKLTAALGSIAAATALIGIWRTQGEFSALAVLGNLLAEPLLVSISLASLVASNPLPAVSFPGFLLADVVGLVPSVLYPGKLDRLFAISNTYALESPLGGLNGLASLLANFGWLGTIVLLGLVCFAITSGAHAVARRTMTPGARLAFVIATTLPLLSLLRDPFVISIYKNLLQNAVLWPALLLLLGTIPVVARRPAGHHPGGTPGSAAAGSR